MTVKNQKMELAIAIGGITLGVFMHCNTTVLLWFDQTVVQMFDSDRVSLIVNAVAIVLGIYIAVVTILATSILGITKNMLEEKKDRQLLHVVFCGMIVNVVIVFYCVLFRADAVWSVFILIVLLIISAISFVKFMHLMFLILQANFDQMAKMLTTEEREKEELLTLLKKIEQKQPSK